MIKIRRCDEPLWRSGEIGSMADAALAAEIVGNAARSGRGLVERSGMEVIYAVYEKDRQQLIAAFVFGSPVDMPNGDVVLATGPYRIADGRIEIGPQAL
jgi:hypothetical protein